MTDDQSQPTSSRPGRAESVTQALMALEGVEAIAQRFGDATLHIELHVPDESILALLVDPDKVAKEAQDFKIANDDDYRLAKAAADALKNEADTIDSSRLSSGGKPLTTLKATWDSLFNPAKKVRELAAQLYHAKMRQYEAKKREEDRKAQEEQERLAKVQKQQLLADAAELEKKAGTLKTPAKKLEALRRAEELKLAAEITPEQFTTSETTMPRLGSGGSTARWVGEVLDVPEFLGWLLKNDTWLGAVEFQQSVLNNLAKQIKDGKKVPGFKAENLSSYRREPKRKQ